ncbi:MAG: tripartite tricarboxylate transporter substrate binding protein [Acetobacteraceae bacterium]|nr:MAG: tripartite tricarboxylate transporter substrate binding protein [Acetobacteraceae bacterium]
MIPRRALLAGLMATPALAQGGYPNQTIRVVVPYVPGGTTDLVGRMVAEALADRLPRPVVVENRGGASGIIGSEAVARAAPDGHMLLLCASAHAVLPELYPNLSWDPLTDFTPIAPVAATPYMLVVHPSLPVQSLADLVALARAQPGRLNFASTGMGTAQHLAGEQLKRLAGIDLLHVSYRGSGAVRADLLTGRINLMFENVALTTGMVQRGEVRAIAVTSPSRTPLAPELPTLAELGYAGAEIEGWFGLLAPPRTPTEVVATLNAAVNDWLRQPAAAQKLAGLGARVLGGTPGDLATIIRSERQRWGSIIRDANIRPE